MFLIGEFSKISRVSKRLLHHYDAIGLLKPTHTDQATGYRYYSARQLVRLNRILALKELGLTLDQIKKVLQDEISDDEIRGMLLMKKAEMEQAVLEDLQRLRRIEARLQQNQGGDDELDIVIKSIPAQPFLSVRTVMPTEEETLQLIEHLHQVVPNHVGSGVLGAFAGIFYEDSFTQTNNDIELGYFLKKPVEKSIPLTEDYVLRMRELPYVETMATSVQFGGPDPVLAAAGKIAQWIEANGYRMAGPMREIGFEMNSLNDMEELVMEIQMPIEKANPLEDVIRNLERNE